MGSVVDEHFRALARCPPSQWLAEEFRNVQADAWPPEAAWQDGTTNGR